nr:aldehyde dehydrogenase family protein [Variovorax sp. dw_954]
MGHIRESVNPATAEVIGTYRDGGAEVASRAIASAATAFKTTLWRSDPMARAGALSHLADAYASRLDDIIDSVCRENGKMRREATYEASHIVRCLRFSAGLATQNFGRVLDVKPGTQSLSLRQAAGVAGLIIPWNSPAYLMIRALAPALAAGCTAVVKMPAEAAQTAALASQIVASVPEIPAGAVNIFIESGAEGAKLMVESPEVPVIHFTGSTATGRRIAQAAAVHLKRVGLELGGKTPHLVFDDADLEALLPVLEKSATVFAGQFCMTGSRILVQRAIASRLQSELAMKLERVRPGAASAADSDMGPMIDKAAVLRVNAMVEEAIAQGAQPIVRGGPAISPALSEGAFYRPTLLAVTSSDLRIVQDEVFGPVQTLQVFDTEEEAIALANDTQYGLSACVWSRDVDRPMRVARRLEAGLISINSWANLAVEIEEGGFKYSGMGRLGGPSAMDDFLETKQISQTFAMPSA